jgi:hypothetical protein
MARALLVGLIIFALVGPARAAQQASDDNLVGVYSCVGTNPGGATYSGIVEIVRLKDTYLVRWTMPNNSQVVGVGLFNAGVLSVSYYGGTPALVVYSLGADGQLEGKWTAGGAEGETFKETLTKIKQVAPRPPRPSKPESAPNPKIKV